MITINNQVYTIPEIAAIMGIRYPTVQKRLSMGWDINYALSDDPRLPFTVLLYEGKCYGRSELCDYLGLSSHSIARKLGSRPKQYDYAFNLPDDTLVVFDPTVFDERFSELMFESSVLTHRVDSLL